MKKIVMLISALLMVCLMATACGGDESSTSTPAADNGSQASTQQPASTQPTSTDPGTVTPAPTGAGSEINFSEDYSANTFFTLTADLGDKQSSGKTAKAGWLNGYVFMKNKQIGKLTTPTYGTKCISFTTTGAAKVCVYANAGSGGATTSDLVLIDANSQVIAKVNPLKDLTYLEIDVPAAGSYALTCGSQVSSVNVWAVKVA